jgi:type IV pilus assembly protein PilF
MRQRLRSKPPSIRVSANTGTRAALRQWLGCATRSHRARLAWRAPTTVTAGLLSAAIGCATARGPSSPDAERQSDAEYDVARDLFFSRRDARGALAHVQQAVALNDQNADAYHFEALIYLSLCSASALDCRLLDAEDAARRAVKLRSDFLDAENTLGVILIQQKKYDEAIAVLQPLAGNILYQTPWDAWGNLGLAYLEKGKVNDAIEALRRSITVEPRFCVGNYRLGLAYEKKGDLSAAREAFSRALETDRPECQQLQDAFEARARVYSKSKNCDLARGDWEKCQKISMDSPAGRRCTASLKSSPC